MFSMYFVMTTGRTGSDYLYNCLDGVEGVMTFSGKFDYHKFFKKKNHKKNKNQLIDSFIKEYENLFSYDKVEDIDAAVNKEKFKKNFLNLSQNNLIGRKEFLINVYKAYHLTLNRDINSAKCLVHHAHGIDNIKKCLVDFPDSKFFITIRDPRANLKSGLNNWFKYDSSKIHMNHIYLYIRRIREDLKFALKLNNSKLFIKLEEAGEFKTKKNICDFLNVNYDKKIEIATINSKPWKGDKLSLEKSKNGEFNQSVKIENWKEYFLYEEIKFLDLIYKDYKEFGYELSNLNFKERFKLLFVALRKFSFEKQTFFLKYGIKKKIMNYFYFFKRIIYSLKITLISLA